MKTLGDIANDAAARAADTIGVSPGLSIVVIAIDPAGAFQVRAASSMGAAELSPNEIVGVLTRAAAAFCTKFNGEVSTPPVPISDDQNGQP